jgi:hypothetical protein
VCVCVCVCVHIYLIDEIARETEQLFASLFGTTECPCLRLVVALVALVALVGLEVLERTNRNDAESGT